MVGEDPVQAVVGAVTGAAKVRLKGRRRMPLSRATAAPVVLLLSLGLRLPDTKSKIKVDMCLLLAAGCGAHSTVVG